MKKSVKAVLWSGLACPGAGHFFLKRYWRGALLFVPALLALGTMVRGLIEQAEFIMDKIESGAVAPDPQVIAALLDTAPATQMTNIAFWILVACWVAGIADAYWLGALQDKEDEAKAKPA
jgi:hypothetical protein